MHVIEKVEILQLYNFTNTYNFVLLQLDVLLAPELLQEFIPLNQLPLDLDGHYMYNHEEWIRFHVVCFSEPLIDSGNISIEKFIFCNSSYVLLLILRIRVQT